MALRWFDGFDVVATADLPKVYNVVGASFRVTAGAGRFSSGALAPITSGGGETVTRFFDDQATWVVGFAFKFDTAGVATRVVGFQDGGSPQVDLRLSATGTLQVTRNGTVLGTGATALLTNTFYFIEFKATVGASGSYAVRLGGVDEVTGSGVNTDAQGTGKANRVALWYDNSSVHGTFDDLYVCDGSGASNNDFLGDMRVETQLADAQGNYSGFSVTGSATHYGAVNETNEDGDASYVHSSTVNARESYLFPTLSSVPTSVAGVKVTVVGRKDDAGTRSVTPFFRIGGTDYEGAQVGLPDSYSFLSEIHDANPATSAAWTGDDVNGAEIGFKLSQ